MAVRFHWKPHLLQSASLLTGMSYLDEPQRGQVLEARSSSQALPHL